MPDTNAALFSKTPPTEPWWYLVRFTEFSEPEIAYLLRDGRWQFMGAPQTLDVPELFGPRIDLPIAAPVECWRVTDECGGVYFYRNREEIIDEKNCHVVRGVFLPLEAVEEEPSDA